MDSVGALDGVREGYVEGEVRGVVGVYEVVGEGVCPELEAHHAINFI